LKAKDFMLRFFLDICFKNGYIEVVITKEMTMWQVEASNANGDFQIVSSLSQKASRKLHGELSNSGNWSHVRSFDMEHAQRQVEATARIQKFGGKS
tara:strand:+ start:1907 stop:2194 length:288 start_codon:yes stop_codon:yes gene_type:complete